MREIYFETPLTHRTHVNMTSNAAVHNAI